MPDAVPQPRGIAGVVGTSLEPFLRGFQESSFRQNVEYHVEQRAPLFATVCPDGSRPLTWTQVHQEYKGLFDQQLEGVLADADMTREELLEFCARCTQDAELLEPDVEVAGTGGVTAAGFGDFLAALTATEDFETFQAVMLQAAARQQRAAMEAQGGCGEGLPAQAPSVPPAWAVVQPGPAQSQEVEIQVPANSGPGQLITVEYLGAQYQLQVPDGCAPGTAFKAALLLPS